MTKWIVTGVIALPLAAALATARWWLPPLWRFAGGSSKHIEGLKGLIDIAQSLGELVAAAVVVLLIAWGYRALRASEQRALNIYNLNVNLNVVHVHLPPADLGSTDDESAELPEA